MWEAIGGPFLGGVANVWSAAEQNRSAEAMSKASMEFSANQAAQQMKFQERMSNTAHQREVEDLKAAGLNPLLSANSGASSPGGAMGSSSTPPVVPELGAFIGGAGDVIKMVTDWNTSTATADAARQQTRLAHEDEPRRRVSGRVWRFFDRLLERYEKNSARSQSPITIPNFADPNRNKLDDYIEDPKSRIDLKWLNK